MANGVKQARWSEPGNWIFYDDMLRHVKETKTGITTVTLVFEDGTEAEINEEVDLKWTDNPFSLAQQRQAEHERKLEPVEEGSEASKNSYDIEIFKGSSQKGTGNRKNGASPSKTQAFVSWVTGAVGGFIVSGLAIGFAREVGFAPWLQIVVGSVTLVGGSWFIHDCFEDLRIGAAARQHNEVLRKLIIDYLNENQDLKTEVKLLKRTSFNTEIGDFIHSYNTAGVEIALGGADPFGPMAEAALRFPALQLHKHLVDAMVFGLKSNDRIVAGKPSEEFIKRGFEEIAWKRIQEMTEGKR